MLLMASTDMKDAKVRKFCMYKFMNNLSIAKINLLFCLFAYVYLFGRSKKVEHWKEEKYASMGDEYGHNFTN